MNLQELQDKVHNLYQKAINMNDVVFDMARLQGDLARAISSGNVTWELKVRTALRDTLAAAALRRETWKEYHKLRKDLDEQTDPKCPTFRGPDEEEVAL
ncbi:MAG: hypothetical protein JXA20_05515 [Spirochaetes bacterium]|nr:hypothetical protein [Spirochaetota bacterium]